MKQKSSVRKQTHNGGITLISLVITIIVLLILATVAISMAVDSNGLFARARKAAEDWNKSVGEESTAIENAMLIMNEMGVSGTVEPEKPTNKPNPPVMLEMKKVMFQEPTESAKGKAILEGEEGFDEANWYNYDEQKWANAQTADGSLWVWIPRFAYKINGEESNPPIDIVFLEGTSNNYYDAEGNKCTAKRASDLKGDEVANTTKEYYVHPAFTDESTLSTPYENGGWDQELQGIWVAKFEAGFASGNNKAKVNYTDLSYSEETVWGAAVEHGSNADGDVPARNWLQGVYGSTSTPISYPVFMGTTYSINYINHNDAFLLCKEISKSGSPYNLDAKADSHMMKNSEWGAVAYLSKSKYGLGSTDIFINNLSLNSDGKDGTNNSGSTGVGSVYAVTGVTGGTADGGEIKIKEGEGVNTVNAINASNGNTAVKVTKTDNSTANIYTWDQQTGTGASSTGTIYGIYDLSGGLWGRTAAYTNNGNSNLKDFGASLVIAGDKATKYTMVYPHDADVDNTLKDDSQMDAASSANYLKNTRIFGDAIRETSEAGLGSTSWYRDGSTFIGLQHDFSVRGSGWKYGSSAGLFSFSRYSGCGTFHMRISYGACWSVSYVGIPKILCNLKKYSKKYFL